MSLNWTPTPKFCAGSTHIGWAAAIFLSTLHVGCPVWLLWVLFLSYIVLKEFWADLTWLEQDSVRGSTFDAITYLVGAGVGWLAYDHYFAGFALSVIVLLFLAWLDMIGFILGYFGAGSR